jgi:hypothetical protein
MDTKLSAIDFTTFALVVGPRGEFISTELVALEPPPPVEDTPAELCTTLNSISLNFKMMADETHFKLTFRKTDNVKTAKIAVARRLRQPGPEWVTLLFKGKALAEAFVLSRLRIGETAISVHVKDASALLLVTGKAMMGQSRRKETPM